MTVGERITAALEKLGMTPAELARQMGVSHTTAYNWVGDKNGIRSAHVPRLASILRVDVSVLSPFGGGAIVPADAGQKKNYVVLVSWSDLDAISGIGKMKMSALKKPGYIEVDINISTDCRAVRVPDNSMDAPSGKSFKKGDIIILDPHVSPWEGCYVLVKLHQTGEHLFRQYVRRSASAYDLIALNPEQYPTVTVNSRFRADIKGVLVEHREKFQRP